VLTYAQGWEEPLSEISRAVTLQRLAASTPNLETVGGDAVSALGRLVAGARCFGFGFGSGQSMLEAVAAALREVGDGTAPAPSTDSRVPKIRAGADGERTASDSQSGEPKGARP
jgi:hypothetical protein